MNWQERITNTTDINQLEKLKSEIEFIQQEKTFLIDLLNRQAIKVYANSKHSTEEIGNAIGSGMSVRMTNGQVHIFDLGLEFHVDVNKNFESDKVMSPALIQRLNSIHYFHLANACREKLLTGRFIGRVSYFDRGENFHEVHKNNPLAEEWLAKHIKY